MSYSKSSGNIPVFKFPSVTVAIKQIGGLKGISTSDVPFKIIPSPVRGGGGCCWCVPLDITVSEEFGSLSVMVLVVFLTLLGFFCQFLSRSRSNWDHYVFICFWNTMLFEFNKWKLFCKTFHLLRLMIYFMTTYPLIKQSNTPWMAIKSPSLWYVFFNLRKKKQQPWRSFFQANVW